MEAEVVSLTSLAPMIASSAQVFPALAILERDKATFGDEESELWKPEINIGLLPRNSRKMGKSGLTSLYRLPKASGNMCRRETTILSFVGPTSSVDLKRRCFVVDRNTFHSEKEKKRSGAARHSEITFHSMNHRGRNALSRHSS